MKFTGFDALYLAALVALACSDEAMGTNSGGAKGGGVDVHEEAAEETEETSDEPEADVGDDEEAPKETLAPSDDECAENADCEDEVACTDDTCVKGKCYHIANVAHCADTDACTIEICNPQVVVNGGCQYKARECFDNDPCTLDTCDPESGCVSTANDPAACASVKSKCMDAVCAPGVGCILSPVNCDDGELNTVDECVDGVGCLHQAVECGNGFSECLPSNQCMITACQSGVCTEKPKNCADAVPCTLDFCDANGACMHVPDHAACPPSPNLCTQVGCDVFFGCMPQDVICDDGNPCTQDFCTEGAGCAAEVIIGCCLDSDDCQDGDPCTEDNCGVDHKCAYKALGCDDNIACTVDACTPNGDSSYCSHTPNHNSCPPANSKCVQSLCDDKFGCTTKPIPCDDGNICTYDPCDPKTGCFTTPIMGCCLDEGECQDGDPCTEDNCNVNHACEHTALTCDDDIACTLDTCVPDGDSSYCKYQVANDLCPTGFCSATLGCVECIGWDDCADDGNLCTYDECNVGTGVCEHSPNKCAENPIYECEPATGNCKLKPGACNDDYQCYDEDGCSKGICDNGQCLYEPTNEGGSCQLDSGYGCESAGKCENGACIFSPDPLCLSCTTNEDCPSNIVCNGAKIKIEYLGACNKWSTCEYSTQWCTSDPCHDGSCKEGIGCMSTPKCDDNDPCTKDSCNWSTGECEEPFPACNDGNLCTTDTCDNSTGNAVCTFPSKCDDGDPCTIDPCDWGTGECKEHVSSCGNGAPVPPQQSPPPSP